jgi:CRISPR type III-B/RAMP module RAMP protein Cmr6
MREMMLPFPPTLAALLEKEPSNRSLAFDKRFDKYAWKGTTLTLQKGAKQKFFDSFVTQYRNAEYGSFFDRRSATLESSTRHFDATLQSRLVLGLGLPHPTETGFLIDRLTGSVYIPGSTVKGLLRSAAELIAAQDLPEPASLSPLIRCRASIFGDQEAAGRLICYDAFPVIWPQLGVDIMTPHHTRYYMNDGIPGDWENPVPVPFLTVARGAHFRFWFGIRSVDIVQEEGPTVSSLLDQIGALLGIALDWLAVGAKKSSGYGIMATDVAEAAHNSATIWKGASLTLKLGGPGLLCATKDGRPADAPINEIRKMIPDDLYDKKLRKGKHVTADVTVEPVGNRFRIVKVEFQPA